MDILKQDLDFYRQILKKVMKKYADIPCSDGNIQQHLIVDQGQNHFMLFDVGWQQKKRVHGCVTHAEIIGDKIWIQRDGIEDGITDELVEAGIPKNRIVLGFLPENMRIHSEYAIA